MPPLWWSQRHLSNGKFIKKSKEIWLMLDWSGWTFQQPRSTIARPTAVCTQYGPMSAVRSSEDYLLHVGLEFADQRLFKKGFCEELNLNINLAGHGAKLGLNVTSNLNAYDSGNTKNKANKTTHNHPTTLPARKMIRWFFIIIMFSVRSWARYTDLLCMSTVWKQILYLTNPSCPHLQPGNKINYSFAVF